MEQLEEHCPGNISGICGVPGVRRSCADSREIKIRPTAHRATLLENESSYSG